MSDTELRGRVAGLERLRLAALAEAATLAAELRELALGWEREVTVRELAAARTVATRAGEFAAELRALVRTVADAEGRARVEAVLRGAAG